MRTVAKALKLLLIWILYSIIGTLFISSLVAIIYLVQYHIGVLFDILYWVAYAFGSAVIGFVVVTACKAQFQKMKDL